MSQPQSLAIRSYTEDPRIIDPIREVESRLRELYLDEDNSLRKVKETIEIEQPQLPKITLSAFEVILREKLKLRKNLPASEWLDIDYHIRKRADGGKKSRVKICGVTKKQASVQKQIRRARQMAVRLKETSPSLPEGIDLATPPLSPMPTFARLEDNERYEIVIEESNWTYNTLLAEVPFQKFLKSLKELLSERSQTTRIGDVDDPLSNHVLTHTPVPINSQPEPANSFNSITIKVSARMQAQYHPSPFTLKPRADPFELLGEACFILSNDLEDLQGRGETLLNWIGTTADPVVLTKFFSLGHPTIAALWERLLKDAYDLRHSNGFATLAEIAIAVYQGGLLEVYGPDLLFIAGRTIHKTRRQTLDRLLSVGAHPGIQPRTLMGVSYPYCLWPSAIESAIIELDIFRLQDLTQSHVIGNSISQKAHSVFIRWESLANCIYSKKESNAELWKCAEMILSTGTNVDYPLSNGILTLLGIDTDIRPLWALIFITDIAWFHFGGHDPLYKLLSSGSKRCRRFITVPGVFTAASVSAHTLSQYIETHRYTNKDELDVLLEVTLCFAASKVHLSAVEHLLQYGVDANAGMVADVLGDKKEQANPAILASQAGNTSILETLWRYGADITRFNCLKAALRGPKGCYCSGFEDDPHFCQCSNVDEDNHGAATSEVVQFLVHNGAYTMEHCVNAMVAATVPTPKIEVVDTLQTCGILWDVERDGLNLLQLALRDQACTLESVQFLLQRGVQVHSIPYYEDGRTMLHDALRLQSDDSPNIARLLLKYKADCKVYGGSLTILETFFMGGSSRDWELFEVLLDHGASVNGPPVRPLLVESYSNPWYPTLASLLMNDAEDSLILKVFDSTTDLNQTGFLNPLQAAIYYGKLGWAKVLIDRGADVNSHASNSYGGMTALQAACNPEYGVDIPIEFMKYLIEKGAEINAPASDEGAMLALHGAVMKGSLGLVCLLLDNGADVNSLASEFWAHKFYCTKHNRLLSFVPRALDWAADYGRLEMSELIMLAGGKSGYPGVTGFDGAIRVARRQAHFSVAMMIERRSQFPQPWPDYRQTSV